MTRAEPRGAHTDALSRALPARYLSTAVASTMLFIGQPDVRSESFSVRRAGAEGKDTDPHCSVATRKERYRLSCLKCAYLWRLCLNPLPISGNGRERDSVDRP